MIQKKNPDGTWTTLPITVKPGQALTPQALQQMLGKYGTDGTYRFLYSPAKPCLLYTSDAADD